MSTPRPRLTPAPVRQDAVCMCAHGLDCSSFTDGHAVHLIQARLVAATAAQWRDALVTEARADGTLLIHAIDDGTAVEIWNGAGAAASVAVGEPVAFHARYHALSAAGRLFNVATLD